MSKPLKRVLAAAVAVVLLAAAALGGYTLLHLNTKNRGVTLSPSKDIPLVPVQVYL